MEDKLLSSDFHPTIRNKTFLVFFGYLFIFLSGIIAVLIGCTLTYKKINMPNGQRVYKYSESDRNHGRQIANMATAIFYLGIILRIFG